MVVCLVKSFRPGNSQQEAVSIYRSRNIKEHVTINSHPVLGLISDYSVGLISPILGLVDFTFLYVIL